MDEDVGQIRDVDLLDALYEAGRSINGALNLKEILRAALTIADRWSEAALCLIYLYIPEYERLEPVYLPGVEAALSPQQRRRAATLAWELLATRQIYASLEPIQTHDPADIADEQARRNWLAVPLAITDHPTGVLVLGSEADDAFPQDQVRLMRVFGTQVAAAIEHARLYEEAQRRWQQTEALRAISCSINATLELPQVLRLVVQSAVETIPAARFSHLFLFQTEAEPVMFEAKAGATERVLPSSWEAICHGAFGPLLENRGPIRETWYDQAHGWFSLMIVSLTAGAQIIGAISVEAPGKNAFLHDDQILLNTFAGHAALAIQNANLYAELATAYQDLTRQTGTLRALFDGITDGLYIVDDRLRLVSVNRAEAKRLGRPPKELVGCVCDSSLWGEAAESMTCLIRQTLSGREGRRWLSRFEATACGPFYNRDVQTYPIFDKSGAVNQVIVFAQDVSEKAQLQASLFRSANLTAIGRLASSIAHEINNPLTVITVNAQLIELDTPDESSEHGFAGQVMTASGRIREIVQNLLDFSTQDRYEWFETEVHTSIEQALLLVSHPLRKCAIDLILELPELPEIIASVNHLKLLWMNLLLNARDAISRGRKGGGEIRIRGCQVDDHHLRIEIIDNGSGIAPGDLDHLFLPFFTTRPPGQGIGLGLHTCRTIITQHGGSIELANNEEGPGATVTVILPVGARPKA